MYELQGAGPRESNVIAKYCRGRDAQIEHQLYELILPRLSVPSIEYLGSVESHDPGYRWIFTTRAGGESYSARKDEHRLAGGNYLGHLHTEGSEIARQAGMSERVVDARIQDLTAVQETILHVLDRPSMSSKDRGVLREIIALLRLVERRWPDLEDASRVLPRVLLHGDFLPHNLRIALHGGRICLLAFDWALAGWGSPVIDLAQSPIPSDQFSGNPDIEAYWSVIRQHWSDVRLDEVRRLAHAATIFQCSSALRSDAPCLVSAWPQESLRNMTYYRDTLQQTLRDLSWQ